MSSARGGRVATFFNMHPGGDVDRRTNLYHAQTDDRGGRWTTADGRRLGIPLRTVENPSLVVDHAARGELIYTCDLNFDREGRPVLLHVVSRGADPGPENGPRRLCLTRWDGSAWRSHVITETDHNYDMGRVWVEGDAWKVIFPNAPGPHEFGCGGEMCLWESTDSSEHWRLARRITRSSHLEHNYARRPLFARDPFSAFWADGDPARFSESRLYFRDSRGERVWRLPTKMTEETALPELADLEP